MLGLSKAGVVEIIHSLFSVRQHDYDMSPALWGVMGEVPKTGLPVLVPLLPIDFSTVDPSYGTPLEKFESHVTGLTSTLQRDLDLNAHQVFQAGDEGATLINSRGLVFIPSPKYYPNCKKQYVSCKGYKY